MPPADILDLSRAAKEAAADALAVFIHSCRTSDDERIRLEAAKQIRDWAFDRPATQDAAPDPTQATTPDREFSDADFWASFTDTELIDHYLDAVRELRGRGASASGVHGYARHRNVPLFEFDLEPQSQPRSETEQPVAEVVTSGQLDLPLEPPPSEPEVSPSEPEVTLTLRSLTPGPGEVLIDVPEHMIVTHVGRVYALRQGLQVISDAAADNPTIRQFIVTPTAGVDEFLIRCEGKVTVPYLGRVYHLKPGVQAVPNVLRGHPIVRLLALDKDEADAAA